MIGLLLWCIVGLVLAWAVDRILGAFGIQDPARTLILVLFVLVLLSYAAHQVGLPPLRSLR